MNSISDSLRTLPLIGGLVGGVKILSGLFLKAISKLNTHNSYYFSNRSVGLLKDGKKDLYASIFISSIEDRKEYLGIDRETQIYSTEASFNENVKIKIDKHFDIVYKSPDLDLNNLDECESFVIAQAHEDREHKRAIDLLLSEFNPKDTTLLLELYPSGQVADVIDSLQISMQHKLLGFKPLGWDIGTIEQLAHQFFDPEKDDIQGMISDFQTYRSAAILLEIFESRPFKSMVGENNEKEQSERDKYIEILRNEAWDALQKPGLLKLLDKILGDEVIKKRTDQMVETMNRIPGRKIIIAGAKHVWPSKLSESLYSTSKKMLVLKPKLFANESSREAFMTLEQNS